MIRVNFLILIVILLLNGSCTSREARTDSKGLIPEKVFISLITDLYIADGLLTLPKYHTMYSSLDSMVAYYPILEKYGYKKVNMDKTLRYYYIKNPKKLISIYDQVLAILSERESRADKEGILEEERKNNLWTGKDYYSLPMKTGSDSIAFNVPINIPGIYTLSFNATLFPDDQSMNTHQAVFTTTDSTGTLNRQFIKTLNFLKDGQRHDYLLLIKISGKTPAYIKGLLYDYDNSIDKIEKHFYIENISLRFSSALP